LPKVLFVTNKDDLATDYLIYKFANYNVPYLRLNSEDITEYSLTYNFNRSICIKYDKYKYNLEYLQSVYFRRAPTIFKNTLDPNDAPFINRERRAFFEGLYLALNVKWINPIFSTYIAERKLFQLKTAQQIGFKIPNTIISNNPTDIKSFINDNNKCIIKPISQGLQITQEGAFSIYTSEIEDTNLLKDNHLFESPILIQNKIENYRDIRATVIGKNILAVEIEKINTENVDWRTPNINKIYRVHTLPKDLESLIYKLHKVLNLIYSAFDFILTPNGEYIFLETNPAGEWVWLEKELKLPISDTIINELLT